MFTGDVSIWKIRVRRKEKRPYQVRWTVGSHERGRSFLTEALAEQFRSDLFKAAKRGEDFDTETGLPTSILSAEQATDRSGSQVNWYDFAVTYIVDRWKDFAATARVTTIESLAAATMGMLPEGPRYTARDVRAAMTWVLKHRGEVEDLPGELADLVAHVQSRSMPLADTTKAAVAQRLWNMAGRLLDGSEGAQDTSRRRRGAVSTALEWAVDQEMVHENLLARIRKKQKKVPHETAVDRRVVANPSQIQDLLTAVSYVGSWERGRGRRMVAFFATLYYAGLRPSEGLGLRETDCELPQHGWGVLTLAETRPWAGRSYTDSGELHDRRGLKQRAVGAIREVPIPPTLVAILRSHVEEFGVCPDGRLFANERGGPLGKDKYARVWREARRLALTPRQAASPLAGRPYDLRHAALTAWLNGGVDPTDVAERAGNSIAVLLKRYAKCMDGRRERNNRLIAKALGLDEDVKGGATDDGRSGEQAA